MPSTHDPHTVELVKDYPKHVFPDPPQRPPEYLAYLEKASMALRSIRLIVFAGLGAFMLLAGYGFFLIYLLTSDARTMATEMQRMSGKMEVMAENMQAITATMSAMQTDTGAIRGDMSAMRANMEDMDRHIAAMDMTTRQMSTAVALIQHSARNLDASVGPAMGAMNKIMPFGAAGNSWPGAGPFMPVP
jgi:hypothetical protein